MVISSNVTFFEAAVTLVKIGVTAHIILNKRHSKYCKNIGKFDKVKNPQRKQRFTVRRQRTYRNCFVLFFALVLI